MSYIIYSPVFFPRSKSFKAYSYVFTLKNQKSPRTHVQHELEKRKALRTERLHGRRFPASVFLVGSLTLVSIFVDLNIHSINRVLCANFAEILCDCLLALSTC